jgi:ribosomal protein L29
VDNPTRAKIVRREIARTKTILGQMASAKNTAK